MQDIAVAAVARVIQLALAPIFLLMAMGTMLVVMTNRLARIVDRARMLQRNAGTEPTPDALRESENLARRARLTGHAITCLTVAALLVSVIVAILFAGAFLQVDMSLFVAGLFVLTMSSVFAGLVLFLREVLMATSSLRLSLRQR